ncbi:MAG: hypothetical protein K8T89_16855 [Planctomycetes bacterium]|nr:hypothetical protein [Planctomycetota bacterium]
MTALENPFASSRANDADDYQLAWDIESHGVQASNVIISAVQQVRKSPAPNGFRKIIVLKAGSGLGKTQIFARVKHKCAADIHLVYVPMTIDPNQHSTNDHIRWKIVDSLFDNKSGFAPLRILMAQLLQPSFVAYFEQLPATDQQRYRTIGNELKEIDSPEHVLQMFATHEIEPYHVLAKSIQENFPDLSRGVLNGFVMGLHPTAARDALTWLRGEEDCITDERRSELLLTHQSPSVVEMLRASAVLFQQANKTMVLCFDQLEFLLQGKREFFEAFRAELMSWLQEIPNLVITVGSLESEWIKIVESVDYQPFISRCEIISLPPLKADEAVELVARRMNSWDGRTADQPRGWPFDMVHLHRFAEQNLKPRAIINQCSHDFVKWLLTDRVKTIRINSTEVDEDAEFVSQWNARLTKLKDQNMRDDNFQESEIFDAFQLAVDVAQLGTITSSPLKETAASKRPSCSVTLDRNGKKEKVLLTFTRKDGGPAFGHWINALEEAFSKERAVGAVTIWPRHKLSARTGAGPTKFNALTEAGKIRYFSLETNLEILWQVLTLREAVLDAQSSQFLLVGKMLSKDQLYKFVRETKVLEGLRFYEFILNEWKQHSAGVQDAVPQTRLIEPTSKLPVADVTRGDRSLSAAPPAIAGPSITSTNRDPLVEQMEALVSFLKKKKQPVIADGVQCGPSFVRFRVRLEADADVAKIQKQSKNLETHLGLDREPIIDNHAGFVSIDVQRKDRQMVGLLPLLGERPANSIGRPLFPAGKDVAGKVHWVDLSEPSSCHLLVAGITGSGKSEFLKTILASLAANSDPSQLRLTLIDPKRVTFNLTGPSPYLMQPPIYEPDDAVPILQQCHEEMRKRYKLLSEKHKSNINELPESIRPPRWVIVLDEFANFMDDKSLKKELETKLKAIASMARAAGIHLILGTQRPEASVVTTLLRSNLPCRIGFQVASGKDSKIIIDQSGAENLLGKGDFLMKLNAGTQRLQSSFVSAEEFAKLLRVKS